MLIGCVFWYLYISGIRDTALESSEPDSKTWWNYLRPVHGSLYIAFALFAFSPQYRTHAWKFLFIDVIIGLMKHAAL